MKQEAEVEKNMYRKMIGNTEIPGERNKQSVSCSAKISSFRILGCVALVKPTLNDLSIKASIFVPWTIGNTEIAGGFPHRTT